MWVYKNNSDNTARFVLGEKGKNPLICFGVNCSIAEPSKLDPTVKRVQNIAKTEGFDGWIMLNVYPLRMTKFERLSNAGNLYFHKENLKHIKNVLKDYPNQPVWAAWGGLIIKRAFLVAYLQDVIGIVGSEPERWVHRGALVGKVGHPHHPLYLRKDAKFAPFDMKKYLQNIRGN